MADAMIDKSVIDVAEGMVDVLFRLVDEEQDLVAIL